MSVQVLESHDGRCVLFCSTTDWAFGPVMGSIEEATQFLEWLPGDSRRYEDDDLERKYHDFIQQYVCECGSVADGVEGQDEEEEGKPLFGYPRTDGQRFVCDYCQKKEKRHA